MKKKNLIYGIISMLIMGIITYQAFAIGETTKAFMWRMDNINALPDGTLQLDVFYSLSTGADLILSSATVTIDPSTDTPNTISTKITDVIITDANYYGLTLSRTNVIIFNFQKGS